MWWLLVAIPGFIVTFTVLAASLSVPIDAIFSGWWRRSSWDVKRSASSVRAPEIVTPPYLINPYLPRR
jgi:hypothetical protein